MAEKGDFAKAPKVLLTNEGPVGRFNRAQRACGNLDESLPLFATGIVLNAAVFGPITLFFAAMYCYGCYRFATDYKAGTGQRRKGFMCTMLPIQVTAAYCLIVAVATLLF